MPTAGAPPASGAADAAGPLGWDGRAAMTDGEERDLRALHDRHKELAAKVDAQSALMDNALERLSQVQHAVGDAPRSTSSQEQPPALGSSSADYGMMAGASAAPTPFTSPTDFAQRQGDEAADEWGAALRQSLEEETQRGDVLQQELGARAMEVQRLLVDLAAAKERALSAEERLGRVHEKLAAAEAKHLQKDAETDRHACKLEADVDAARADLARVESELAGAQDRHVEQSLQVSRLTADLQRRDEQSRALQAAGADRDRALAGLQARVSELETLLDGRDADAKRAEAQHQAARQEAAAQKKQCHAAEDEISRLKAFEARNLALAEKLEVLEACLARAEDERQDDAGRLKGSKRRIEELEFKVAEVVVVKNRLTDAEADAKASMEAVKALQAQLRDAEGEMARQIEAGAAHEQRVAAVLGELRQAQVEKEAADGETALLRLELTRLNTMEGQIKGLEAMLDTKEVDIRRLRDDAVQSLDTIRRLEAACAELEPLKGETEHLAAHYDGVEHRLHEAEVRAEEAARRGEQLEAEAAKLEEILEEKDALVGDLQRQVDAAAEAAADHEAHKAEAESLRGTAEDLHASLAATEEHLAEARASLDHYTGLAAALREQLSSAEGAAAERGDALDRLQDQHTAATRSVQDLSQQVRTLSVDLARHQRDAEDWRSKSSRLETEQASATERLAATEAKLQRASAEAAEHAKRAAELEGGAAELKAEAQRAKEEGRRTWERLEKVKMAERHEQEAKGRLEELQRSYAEKVDELHRREQDAVELSLRLKDAEANAGRASQLQTHLADVKTSLERQRGRVGELEALGASKDRHIAELQRALEEERRDMQQKNEIQCNLMSRLQEFEVTLTEIEPRLAEKSVLEGKLAGLEADLANKVHMLDRAAAEQAELLDRAARLESQAHAASAESGRVAALQEELRSKGDMVHHLQQEADAQRKVKGDLRQELDQQTHKAQLADEELQRLAQIMHDLEGRVKTLTCDLEDEARRARDAARKDEARIRQLEGEVAELTEQSRDSASHTQLLADRRRANEDDLRRQKERIDELEEEKGRVAVEFNDLCEQLREERESAAAAYKQLAQLRDDFERCSTDLALAQGRAGAAETQLEHDGRVKTKQVEAANRMVDELRLELEKVTCQQSLQAAALVHEKEEVVRLEKRCRQQDEAARRMERANTDLRSRCDSSVKQQRLAELRLQERDRESSRQPSLRAGHTTPLHNPSASPYATPLPKAVPTPLPLRSGYSGGTAAPPGGLHATREKLQRLETELHSLRRRQDGRGESRRSSPYRHRSPYTPR